MRYQNNEMFSRTVQSITMKQVAERYGFEVNKANKIVCPFHNDTHPSLHIYPDNRGWYCFVCGKGGSIIDFVAKLFSVNPMQAVIRLDNDFHLGLSTQKPDRRAVMLWAEKRRKEQAEREALHKECVSKINEFRSLWYMKPPPQETPQDSHLWGEYAAKLGRRDYLDYWIDNTEWR